MIVCVLLYGVRVVCDALCFVFCCNTCAVVISCVAVWFVFCVFAVVSPVFVCVVIKCVRVMFVV